LSKGKPGISKTWHPVLEFFKLIVFRTGIRKSRKVRLGEVKTDGLPHNYQNLSDKSDGKDIPVGIFMHAQK